MSCSPPSELFNEILSCCEADDLDQMVVAARKRILVLKMEALACPMGMEIQAGSFKYESRESYLKALVACDEHLRAQQDEGDVFYLYQPVNSPCHRPGSCCG